MDTYDTFNHQHIFWKSAVKHEKTATHNFNDGNRVYEHANVEKKIKNH